VSQYEDAELRLGSCCQGCPGLLLGLDRQRGNCTARRGGKGSCRCTGYQSNILMDWSAPAAGDSKGRRGLVLRRPWYQ
jgi:hypothetical protein